MSTTNATKITDAAIIEATRLCDIALAALVTYGSSPARLESTRRAQVAVFRNAKMSERIVCDLLRQVDDSIGVGSREELLAFVSLYQETGVSEVCCRFAA